MTDLLTPANRGVLTRTDDGWELRFERRLRHPPRRVWAALTTGDGLACWLAEAEIDLAPGGRMDLYFRQPDHEFMPDVPERRRQSNRVLTVREPWLFEHTFGDERSVVSWRLAPDGDGTHLTLVHRIPADWAGARDNVLSGWHHHMEGLDAAGRGQRHPWDWDRWFALRDAYAAAIAADPQAASDRGQPPQATRPRGPSGRGQPPQAARPRGPSDRGQP